MMKCKHKSCTRTFPTEQAARMHYARKHGNMQGSSILKTVTRPRRKKIKESVTINFCPQCGFCLRSLG